MGGAAQVAGARRSGAETGLTHSLSDRRLHDNLACLRAAATYVPDLTLGGGDRLRLEDTPAGPSALLKAADGRWVRLHSGRDPMREAEGVLADLVGDVPPALVLVGAGLGYMLEAIERRSPSTRVLLVEPLGETVAAMLARKDWREWADSGRLHLLVGPDYAGDSEAWRFLGPSTDDPPIVVTPVFARARPEETAKARDVAQQVLFGARANAEARRQFAPRYLLNTLRNARAIARAADVDALKGAFADVPAIVVAAGPSLDGHLDDLRRVGNRALIIAVDTAVRPLLDAGIHPHLAVGVDPSAVNGRHLQDLRNAEQTFLVAEGSLAPEALAEFAGRLFVFTVADHQPWPWLRSLGCGRGRLRAWGSVLTSTFDLARQAGCNPIVFAGADLAYSKRRPYCRGTAFEDDWASQVAAGASIEDVWRTAIEAKDPIAMRAYDGAEVLTAPPLVAFRNWIVEQTGVATDRRFINATGAGILTGPRIEHRSLREVVAVLPNGACEGRSAVARAWTRERRDGGDIDARIEDVLGTITDESSRGEPLESWLAFTERQVSREDIAAALRSALDDRPRQSPRTAPLPPPRCVLPYAPERVALIRDAIEGGAGIEATVGSLAAGANIPRLTEATARVDCVLRQLILADPPLLAGEPGTEPTLSSVASRGIPWHPAVRHLIAEFEAALADFLVSRIHYGDTKASDVLACETTVPTIEERAADRDARLSLVAEWLTARTGRGASPIDHGDSATSRITGLLLLTTDDAVLPRGRVAPMVLNADGRPSYMIGSVRDEHHALFAEVGGTGGICIDAHGRCLPDAPWPRPISGLVHWGEEGAVAWRNPYVMWRDSPSGETGVDTLPFRASRAYPQQDGSIWWTACSGGVWSWVPGGPWQQLVDSPPIMSLHAERGAVRLDPRNDDFTFEKRPDATDAFLWTPGTRQLERRPLGAGGPCWSISTADAWTAHAFPYGNRIHLRRDNGTAVALACPGPFSVAWAGGSLVASTLHNRLLLFPGLLTWLQSQA